MSLLDEEYNDLSKVVIYEFVVRETEEASERDFNNILH